MKTVKIDVTLLIVLLTGLAYGTAYLYEAGYQLYYELPLIFIDLNITTLTKSLFFTIVIAGALFAFSTFIGEVSVKSKDSMFADIPLWVLIVGSAIVLFLAVNIGHWFAEGKERYMVVKQKEELFVVVTSYKDNLVIAPLDIKKESIKPKFQTIETKDAKDTEVIRFKDGIKVDEVRSSKEFKKEITQKPLNKK